MRYSSLLNIRYSYRFTVDFGYFAVNLPDIVVVIIRVISGLLTLKHRETISNKGV